MDRRSRGNNPILYSPSSCTREKNAVARIYVCLYVSAGVKSSWISFRVSSERFPHQFLVFAVSDVGRVTRCQVPWESHDCVFMCKNVSRCWGQRSWWETWQSWTDERGVTHSRHPHIIFYHCVIMTHSEDQLESKPNLSFQAKGNLTNFSPP